MSAEESAQPRGNRLEVRYNFHANAQIALFCGAMAAIAGGYLVYVLLVLGKPMTAQAWILLAVFIGSLGLTVYNASMMFDRRSVLTLTPAGFRDRRTGDVLIPWRIVASGGITAPGRGSNLVVFSLTADPAQPIEYDFMSASGRLTVPFHDERKIRIETNSLDISPQDILTAAKQFAPHIEIDPRRVL